VERESHDGGYDVGQDLSKKGVQWGTRNVSAERKTERGRASGEKGRKNLSMKFEGKVLKGERATKTGKAYKLSSGKKKSGKNWKRQYGKIRETILTRGGNPWLRQSGASG